MPDLPPLYKYLDLNSAKLSLSGRCFKHSKPSDFNDLEDLTVQSIFPETEEEAIRIMEDGFTQVLLDHLRENSTALNPELQRKVAILQKVYATNPDAAKIVEAAKKEIPPAIDAEYMKKRNRAFIEEINAFMQGYRVLCVSEKNDSPEMWELYAGAHTGIALRITPNVAKDSKYQCFQKVQYRDARPSLYDSAATFQKESLFGDQVARIAAILEKIIVSKTRDWEYESEYRLAIPLRPGEKEWNTLRFHPEEITEIYLGSKMREETMIEIVGLAKSVNPDIEIFRCLLDEFGKVKFQR